MQTLTALLMMGVAMRIADALPLTPEDRRQLETAIHEYLALHNESPKPFIWTATHQDILGKVAKAKAAMAKRQEA